jgi:hypothetical protein
MVTTTHKPPIDFTLSQLSPEQPATYQPLIDSMTQQEQQIKNDRSYNDEEAQLLEYECLKFDSTNETPTTCPVDLDSMMMEIDSDGDNVIMPPIDSDSTDNDDHVTSEGTRGDDRTIFGFSRMNYMSPLHSWSTSGKVVEDCDPLPAMVRSNSGLLSTSDTDDTMSSSSGGSDDDTGKAIAKGVTFNETVRVMPIPPLTSYTAEQRFRMYANRFELRENKLRNKKEFQFDGYDWRNATEECQMAICPISGEILHPAHL